MKIGYLCKYAPVEILRFMGAETELVMPDVIDFSRSDRLMHTNMCSFIKGVLEEFEQEEESGEGKNRYDGLLLTHCCDSTRRLFDVMKERYPGKFIYMIDVPRISGERGAAFFSQAAEKMAEAYSEFSGVSFDSREFMRFLREENGEFSGDENKETAGKTDADRPEADGPERERSAQAPLNIGLMGARCSRGVLDMLYNYNINIIFDMTCTGVDRKFEIVPESRLEDYTGQLLLQTPCMRMNDISSRRRLLESFTDRLDGIIYHTVKFCDNYSYEYAELCGRCSVPLQKFETDATSQCQGQIRTRVEAFLESLMAAKGLQTSDIDRKKEVKKHSMNGKMRVLGIDSGSTSTNAVIMNQDREIEAYAVVRTGAKSGESADAVFSEVLGRAGLAAEDIDLIVSTGYGRVSIPFAHRNVTEISCHGKGAHYFYPEVRTVLDIGGQDSKAIRLNEKGDVIDFVMNDKCAAGTGRFLEMMARTLEVDIEELGKESLRWKEDLDISSMCSVFAESEVISLIADNREKCDIAHGIHKAVANKSVSLMKRVGLEPGYMMTGGVAKNPGAVREIEEKLGEKLFICEEPEIVGAAGAALFGLEELEES